MSWQAPPPPGSQPPPMGFYPGQSQGPAGGFYPGYPNQPGYPPQQGYPTQPPPQGYPNQPPGYPGQQGFSAPFGGIPPQPIPVRPEMYGTNYDPEDPLAGTGGFEFSDKSIRHGFIRKVYAILMIQLTVTLSFITLFLFHLPTKNFVRSNVWLLYVSIGITFVCLIAMSCCGNLRRKFPTNFILLSIFTLAESFVLGTVSSVYNSEEVMLAVGITAAVCLGLSIFAFQTKWDFTMMGGMLFVAAIILLLFGFIAMIFKIKILTLVYASLGAVIFSFYLIYDTQMMIGGKHKYSISPEEYIFAALTIYLDIINIFMYILTIIGASRSD